MNSKIKNSVIALGTGTSTGIPMVGCSCAVCASTDKYDQRMRTSIFLETSKGKKILVDTSPDLRTQLLVNKISDIDFVIMTHEHADHLHGIDDLRPLTFGPPLREKSKVIPLYCNQETSDIVEKKFEYIFKKRDLLKNPILGGGIPNLSLNVVEQNVDLMIDGEEFYFFNYPHGAGQTMGFLHEGLAYIVDCMEIPGPLLEILSKKNIDLLILDCLQRHKHSTHLTVEKAFNYIKILRPKKTGLIHISHDLSHKLLTQMASEQFGADVFPLYDQQKMTY